jgi:hypothetical protein
MKTGAALKSILKDPLPFVKNLVAAAKLGLSNFADHFGAHLKQSLIDWLTGSLQGVYIPQALSLVELGKFALSVLGISWAQIRGKIVKALGPNGETIMKAMETGFDIVVALVKGGVAAAWELIKEKLTNLKDMVVDGIVGFVTDTIIQKAIPKLVSLFVPGAGFISAIVSIYDTIKVFIDKLAKIVAVVKGFIDSIVAIAAGQIAGAAARVESALADGLTLVINFLAGFLGLTGITEKIMGVVKKVRETVDKALDTAINFVIGKAKDFIAKLLGKGKPDNRTDAQKQADLDKGISEAEALRETPNIRDPDVRKGLVAIQKKYNMTSLELVVDAEDDTKETVHIEGEINPKKSSPTGPIGKQPGDTKKNPILIDWVKPAISAYPSIKLEDDKGKTITARPTGQTTISGVTIGVTYAPPGSTGGPGVKKGDTFQVLAQVSGNSNKDSMNRLLKAHGYDRDEGGSKDNDHHVEKQLGGPDDVGNLWPLDQGINRSSGSSIRGAIANAKQDNKIKDADWPGKWIKLN